MMNIAVFASGRGSNFQAISDAVRDGKLKVNLSLLVCDNPQADVLKKAEVSGVRSLVIRREDFTAKEDFEAKIIQVLKKEKIDLIVLAGFMRILSPAFISEFRNRIINIHPALLPAFKGADGIKDAFDYGVKVTGVTVHFVDEQTDHGPIILQAVVEIKAEDTLESLEERIHKTEHQLYPQSIQLFAENKLRVVGRKVIVSHQ
jgi:phosphoribosylglycinamide formyltransferase-1